MAELAIVMHGVEMLLIACGGFVLSILGFKLFQLGIKMDPHHVVLESKLGKLIVSGTAPGLFFMLGGCFVFVFAIQKAEVHVKTNSADTTASRDFAQGNAVASAPIADRAASKASEAQVGFEKCPAVAMASAVPCLPSTRGRVTERKHIKKAHHPSHPSPSQVQDSPKDIENAPQAGPVSVPPPSFKIDFPPSRGPVSTPSFEPKLPPPGEFYHKREENTQIDLTLYTDPLVQRLLGQSEWGEQAEAVLPPALRSRIMLFNGLEGS
ncbi:hypothetical protein PQR75_26320 [Paraburkholderia fungorum]|uniref:hypothetical protein n=1 Tax=Paraburkholderia fungorum TaxID=134537 RepID=UPI0038B74D49